MFDTSSFTEAREQIENCIFYARLGLIDSGLNGKIYDEEGNATPRNVEIGDIDLNIVQVAPPTEEDIPKEKPKVTCVVDDINGIEACLRHASIAFTNAALNGGFIAQDGEYLNMPVSEGDMDFTILHQNAGATSQETSSGNSPIICHIGPDEDSEDKIDQCRYSAALNQIDLDNIQ
jgi:hypothetical protein